MAKRSKSAIGLGKGLDALLPSNVLKDPGGALNKPAADDGESVGVIALIELDRVRPNPLQPRIDFEPGALEDLKNSIKEKGVIQPITVRRVDDGYEIIAGERRFRACKENNFDTIPAYILDVGSDAEMLELAIIENVQREHLNPVEVAKGYQRLIEECGLTQEEVAQKVGKERSTVTNFLRLLKLDEEILNGLREKLLSMGQARTLLGVSDLATQAEVYRRVLADGLSVRKTEELVRLVESGKPVDVSLDDKKDKAPAPPKPAATEPVDPELDNTLKDIESNLRQLLATQVRVKPKSKGGGSIEIDYYSPEQLESLLDLFAKIESDDY